ncbi:heparinase II/III domain-containing protein [Hankyongella ginsenosidimutans]|uniref:heparinase II/III domain-containing protein n=1 Tax=Hankyongella ginsenosidimutans TaxID=1763828 RepID=UPI001CA36C53
MLKLPNGVLWAFKARGAKLRVDDSLWVDSLGKVRRTRQLVLTGDTAEDGAQVRWSFKRGTRS